MPGGSIGSLLVTLSADISQFQSDLGRAAHIAQAQALSIQRAFAAVRTAVGSAVAVVGIAEMIDSYKRVVDAAEQAKKSAEKFGTTTESFSSLAYAAKGSGVDVQGLDAAMTKLADKMADAAGGGKQSEAVFKSLGITVEAGTGKLKGTDEILRDVAEKFAGYKDGAAKAALATELFGKSGTALIPMLNNLKASEEEAKRLGVIFGTDMAKASADLNDNMTRLNATFTASKIVLLNDLLPTLNKFLEQMTAGIQIAGSFTNAMRLFGLSTITSSNAGEKIKEIGVAIEGLNADRAKFAGKKGREGIVSDLDARLDDAKKKLEFAKFLQRQAALALLPPGGVRDENKRFAKPLGDAPIVPKTDQGATDRARQKQLDDAAKIELEALKDLGQQRSAILDALHADNLIGERDYWATKVGIAKEATDAELKVLADQKARQEDVLSKQKKGSKEYYDALGNVQETQAKVNKVTAEFQQIGVMSFYGATRAAEQYRREVEDVNIQILELKGNIAEAAARRQDLSDESLIKKARANNDPELEAAIKTRKELIVAQAEFNKAREDQGMITTRLGIEEERIQNSQRTGAISEIDALMRTGNARKATADQLEGVVRNMERVAEASKNPALILQAEQARASLEKLRTESDLLADKFDTIFKDRFAEALDSVTDKTKSTTEKIKGFFEGLSKDITKIISQSIATDVSKWVGLGGGGGSGGGFGGFLSGIFGGSGGNYNAGPVTGPSSFVAGTEGLFGSFAEGTDYVPRTGPYMLHQGEEVIPRGAGGGVVVNMTINTPDANSFRQSQGQIAAEMAARAGAANKRYR